MCDAGESEWKENARKTNKQVLVGSSWGPHGQVERGRAGDRQGEGEGERIQKDSEGQRERVREGKRGGGERDRERDGEICR